MRSSYIFMFTVLLLLTVSRESSCSENAYTKINVQHFKANSRFEIFSFPKKVITLDSVRSLCHIDEIQGTRPSNLPRHFSGKGVLFGLIDTEFDTHHPTFLDNLGKTRFIAIWDQGDTIRSNNRFGFGTIKNHQELLQDSLFATEGEPHGTHTASVAAGSDQKNGYQGVAPDVLIAGVRYDEIRMDVKNGIKWLFSLADSLKIPCVINLSLGESEGPHDGTSELDMYIDSVVGPGRIVVGAIGNDYVISTHALFNLKLNDSTGTIANSKLYVNKTDSIYYSGLDIWSEPQKTFSCNMKLFNKKDSSMSTIATLSTSRSTTKTGQYLYRTTAGTYDTVEYKYFTEKANSRNSKPHINILYQTNSPGLDCAITLKPLQSNGIAHCWHLSRSYLYTGGISGNINGDGDYSVKEIGGTAKRIIVAGSFYGRTSFPTYTGDIFPRTAVFGQIAHFSGNGPTVDGRIKPDITAPGWSVIAAFGRNGTPENEFTIWPDIKTTSGRYSEATGTSTSAPIVAGVVALMLEADPLLTPETARTLIQQSAIHDEFTGQITGPVNRWGAGKLNALGAMQRLLNITSYKAPPLWLPPKASLSLKCRLIQISGIRAGAIFSLFNLQGKLVLQKNLTGYSEFDLPQTIAGGLYTAVIRSSDRHVLINQQLALVK